MQNGIPDALHGFINKRIPLSTRCMVVAAIVQFDDMPDHQFGIAQDKIHMLSLIHI